MSGFPKTAPPGTFAQLVALPTGVPATDTAAITAAIAALPAGGGKLRLQPGTYAVNLSGVSGVFAAPAHIVIEGAGQSATFIQTETNLTASGTCFTFPGNVSATFELAELTMVGPATVDSTITETDNGTAGGTFTLTGGANTTGTIAADASAATIDAALTAASIAHTSVTGGPLGTAAVVVHGATPLVVGTNSLTNASLTVSTPTCQGVVGSGANHSMQSVIYTNVYWTGYWIHCSHLGAGVADGVEETGVHAFYGGGFNIIGSPIADFRGGSGTNLMDAELYISPTTIFEQFGVPGTNLYHGTYLSPGVSIYNVGRYFSNAGATGYACQQYNQNLDGRLKITVTQTGGTPSGTFTITTNGQTTAPIAYNAPATGVGSVKAALDALTGMGTTYVTGGPPTNGAALPASWTYNVGLGFTATVDGTGLTNASVAAATKTMSVPKFVYLSPYIGPNVSNGLVVMSGIRARVVDATIQATGQQIRYYTSVFVKDSDLGNDSTFGALFAGGETGVAFRMRGTKKGKGTSNTGQAPITMGSNSGLVNLWSDEFPTLTHGTSPVAVAAAASPAPTLVGADGRSGRHEWSDMVVAPIIGAFVPRSGDWLGPKAGAESTTANMVSGTEYAYPLEVPYDITIQAIGLEITSAGGSGALVRLGIRLSDVNGYPGTLLADLGTIDGTKTFGTTPGVISGLTQKVPAGTVWITGTVQGAPSPVPTVRTFTGNVGAQPRQALNSSSSGCSAQAQTGVTGGLPNGFSATVAAQNFAPAVMVQLA